MFTGIVETTGRVLSNRGGRLTVRAGTIAAQIKIGGSVAVNGACLTAVGAVADYFEADVVPETRRRTNLEALEHGDEVNLELPLTLQQPLDGHLVQGHVDGVGTVIAVEAEDESKEIEVELPADLRRYVAVKGSIAVDGVSLTVAAMSEDKGSFRVALIPHTLEKTIARTYVAGSKVNLEVDLLARYLERLAGI